MTWKELKLITLQKVFAVSDGKMAEDDTTREYLTAMPGAANEGLDLLATAGRFLKKQMILRQVQEEAEAEPGVIRRVLTGKAVERYDMETLTEDYYGLDADGVYREDGSGYRQASDWSMEAGRYLILPGDRTGQWTVYYNAYPRRMTAETADSYELPLYPEMASLLPLYMASQLYKDDELGVAVQYRNEFEVGRGELMNGRGRPGAGKGKWSCTTGWW